MDGRWMIDDDDDDDSNNHISDKMLYYGLQYLIESSPFNATKVTYLALDLFCTVDFLPIHRNIVLSASTRKTKRGSRDSRATSA